MFVQHLLTNSFISGIFISFPKHRKFKANNNLVLKFPWKLKNCQYKLTSLLKSTGKSISNFYQTPIAVLCYQDHVLVFQTCFLKIQLLIYLMVNLFSNNYLLLSCKIALLHNSPKNDFIHYYINFGHLLMFRIHFNFHFSLSYFVIYCSLSLYFHRPKIIFQEFEPITFVSYITFIKGELQQPYKMSSSKLSVLVAKNLINWQSSTVTF